MRFRFGVLSLLLAVALLGVCLALYGDSNRDVCVYRTGRELDSAIVGRGYFQLTDPETGKVHYTRRGRFYINADGVLAAGPRSDSPPLEPPICIPQEYTKVTITPTGCVLVYSRSNSYSPAVVGNLELTMFPDDAGLEPVGDNRYVANEETGGGIAGEPGGPDGAGFIQQFWLEGKPPTDAAGVSKLLVAIGCAAGLVGLCWIKRRFEQLEASVDCLARSFRATDNRS